jgi:hypothetical protein
MVCIIMDNSDLHRINVHAGDYSFLPALGIFREYSLEFDIKKPKLNSREAAT